MSPNRTRRAASTLPVLALAATLLLAGCSHRGGPAVEIDDGPAGTAGGRTGDYADSRGGAGSAPIAGSVEDFAINVGDRVFFDLDSHQIRAEAYPRLDAQAQWLLRYPGVLVRIEGNADERGTRDYNLALGARRAEAVRSYLISRGVPASRIDTISYGKERPIAFGSNEAAFAQNRNAHTAITPVR